MLSTILQNGRNCDLGLSSGLKVRVTRVSHYGSWSGRVGCEQTSLQGNETPQNWKTDRKKRRWRTPWINQQSLWLLIPIWGLCTVRGFRAEGDAQVQRGVSGERGDPKRKATTGKLYRVWWMHSCWWGGEGVSKHRGCVTTAMQQKGRMCKKEGYKTLGHRPQGLAGGRLGLSGVCSHPSSKGFSGSVFASSLTTFQLLCRRTVPTAGALPGLPFLLQWKIWTSCGLQIFLLD